MFRIKLFSMSLVMLNFGSIKHFVVQLFEHQSSLLPKTFLRIPKNYLLLQEYLHLKQSNLSTA